MSMTNLIPLDMFSQFSANSPVWLDKIAINSSTLYTIGCCDPFGVALMYFSRISGEYAPESILFSRFVIIFVVGSDESVGSNETSSGPESVNEPAAIHCGDPKTNSLENLYLDPL